eukprot:UN00779
MKLFRRLRSERSDFDSGGADILKDSAYDDAKKQYFETENAFSRLCDHIKKYNILWNQLISLRSKIAGDLLFFYESKTHNRKIIENYISINTNKIEPAFKLVQKECEDIVDNIEKLDQREFKPTQTIVTEREKLRKKVEDKRKRLMNYTIGNYDREEAARKHTKLKELENDYHKKNRTLRTRFSDFEDSEKISFTDNMIKSLIAIDKTLLSELSKTAPELHNITKQLQENEQKKLQIEEARMQKRGESSNRKMSIWTAGRVASLKRQYTFVDPVEEGKNIVPEYYFRKEIDRNHPLDLRLMDIRDWNLMHELFNPECKKHPKNPDLK